MNDYVLYSGFAVLLGVGGMFAYKCLFRKDLKSLLGGYHSKLMTRTVEDFIKTTPALNKYSKKLRQLPPQSAEALTAEIAEELKLGESERNNLSLCMQNVIGARQAISFLEELRATKYDRENDKHEKLLMSFWEKAMSGVTLPARDCEEWKDLGFQGVDPATDFRGGGLLSLLVMVHMATKNKAVLDKIVREANDKVRPDSWYMYAVAAINFTLDVLVWAKAGRLDAQFYHVALTETDQQASGTVDEKALLNNAAVDTFCTTVADLMVYFHQQWLEKQPHTMEFNMVKDQWFQFEKLPPGLAVGLPLAA